MNGDRQRTERQENAVIEAAWSYYHDGLNQSEIAKRMGISRATVVNYLAEARERKFVQISLNPEVFRSHKRASELMEQFGLQDAQIVPPDPQSNLATEKRVARAAAEWLPNLLEPGDTLGVAWGETIYLVSEYAPVVPLDDLTVVQLVGSRPSAKGFAAESCSATIAARFSAHCVNLHVPLILSSEDVVRIFRNEPSVAQEIEAMSSCNKTIFAAGTLEPDSHIIRSGLMQPEILAHYKAKGAVGVVCGRLIDEAGIPVKADIEARMIGVELEHMRNKDMALLVGAGPERTEPMRAALLGGYATHLVTCSDTARQLLTSEA